MKMYILIRESVPLGIAMTAVGHAAVACYRKYEATEDMKTWLEKSFKKVVCKVSDEEFEKVKSVENNIVLTESSIANQETAIVFAPRKEFPKQFKFYRLYK